MSPLVYSNVGKYERKKLLGRGHFGEVFEVYDRVIQAPRALKIIEARDPSRLIEKLLEARLLEICRHKHVVEVKEANIKQVDGRTCVIIATELISKGSAQGLLEREYVPLSRSIKIVQEALFGLEHLHDNNVVHCDIKPGNLLLAEEGTKLSDFGLALTLQSGKSPSHLYTRHMAPESTNAAMGTKRCDIYAMGVTLYRLINNIKNLPTVPPHLLKSRIKKGIFPDRTAYQTYIPEKIKNITNKAMHVDPSKRYQSAFNFRQALERLTINIDWTQKAVNIWDGNKNEDVYCIRLLTRPRSWCVDFTKNSRRKLKYCKAGFKNNWDAEKYMCKTVAHTSLQ